MPSRLASLFWKLWYPYVTRLTRDAEVTFLNYGYVPLDSAAMTLQLDAADEPNRPCIQLYDHVAGSIPLQGLRVLEVSCGHGGGSSYIARYFKPETMHGVDRNPKAVELCRRKHSGSGLVFSQGDALALEFADESFDAVINVEASHCYPDMPRFLGEVVRVLRPGGHLLYADFREAQPDSAILHQQLESSGLTVVSREDISANVVRGMQLNTEKYSALIDRVVPSLLRKPAVRFAGVPGSMIYNELVSGKTVYVHSVLAKGGRMQTSTAG